METEWKRFDTAAAVLPAHLRRAALALPSEQRALAEEIRVRTGREMTVLLPEGERGCGITVEQADLEALCNLAADHSRYAAMETLRQGFLPLRGGCRVGLCGTAVMKDGAAVNWKDFSSAAIRIVREKRGIADDLVPQLFRNGRFCGTLILSPPGGGKTTLLREVVRCISDGGGAQSALRVALADERGEIAAVKAGVPQLDVGQHTDVLDGCPKAEAVPILLRCMNPQVVAVDEITLREDIRAMVMAANCGAALLATIHAGSVEELRRKPLYRELLEAGVFQLAVILQNRDGVRSWQIEELEC